MSDNRKNDNTASVTKSTIDRSGKSNNPYQPPADFEQAINSSLRLDSALSQSDKAGMLSLIVAGGLLVGMDYAVLNVGFLLIFGPPVLFFCLTLWANLAISRDSDRYLTARIAIGIGWGLLVAPAGTILLMATCIPTTTLAGVGFDIHGNRFNLLEGFLAGTITFALTAGIGGVIFFVASRLARLYSRMR